ncbi:MAG: anti-sigma factor antagonist [Ilumatobacteraceae bacterium]
MDLRTRIDVVGSVAVLALSGSVDLATLPRLQDGLLRLAREHPGKRLVVDLDGVDVLDDTALGVLLGAAGRARESGGELTVVCASERLRQRFAVTGLDRAVDVVGGLAQLLAS